MPRKIFIFTYLSLATIASGQQAYLPPFFEDPDRLSKMEEMFPQIDQIYKAYAEQNHVVGYAYGVLLDGQLVHSGAGGFSDLKTKTPATARSMFHIASMTKSFTAMAILRLRDENKLKLDDPIYLYFPEMKDQHLTDDAPDITIRDLLTHAEGFPTDDPWADRKLDERVNTFLAMLKKGIFFSNVPQVAFEYSNLGYVMLGYIIEKITGKPYTQFIDETVGLQGMAWDFTQVPPSQLVHGYKWENGEWKEEPLLRNGIFGAMGGLITSIEAFSQYVAFHQSAWPPRNEEETGPLKRSSLREMHQAQRLAGVGIYPGPDEHDYAIANAYGYGLRYLCDQEGREFVGHSGGLPGFGCHWCFMPHYGIGIILFTNARYSPVTQVNMGVLYRLLLATGLKPRFLPPSALLTEKKNALVKLLPDWEQAPESGLFAGNFFLDHPLQPLREKTRALFTKIGKVLSVSDVIAQNQLSGYFTIHAERGDLRVDLSLAPDGRIQQCKMY